MIEILDLSCVPVDEKCEQLGVNYDPTKAIKECRAFIRQLRRQFGEEPFGAQLKITSNPHDFGTYHEVAVKFHDQFEEAVEYAFKLESELPEKWDDGALRELGLFDRLVS
jgi:hypothetical protein